MFIVTAAIVACALALQATTRKPVTFKNLDEEQKVYGAARWAAKQLNMKSSDSRLRYSLLLWIYAVDFSWLGSIPVEELALLAPFIDMIIDGKGPPINQPPEYDDTRPEILGRFKKRMQDEGLWPQSQS